MLNALESVIGRETFAGLYRRCLREYAGKRLGWREFQRAAELQSGQDLDWFFEAWVRSGANAFYKAAAQECAPAAGGFDCTVKVESVGEMRMPLTIAARFEDGTEQRARADRTLRSEELRFRSKALLREVAVDPDHEYVLVDTTATVRSLALKIGDLSWGADPAASMAIYRQDWKRIEDAGARFRLGLLLYDGRHYAEALEAMKTIEAEPSVKFIALAWQGMLLDLLGRRAEAVTAYQAALEVPGTPRYRHDQWALAIDKAWVGERVRTAYQRK
jgi:tetratricopeptide (TPR) repeat protein